MKPDQEVIVRRAAWELAELAKKADGGILANLGIGMPTLIPSVLPEGLPIVFHSENGFIGMGPPVDKTRDHEVIDAGGRAVSLLTGAAAFDSLLSFSIVRGGKLDVAVLGAFEVGINGDLANWMIPGKLTPGMGGGMELAQKARNVIVVSSHLDKHGNGKLKSECTLPLTAARCVNLMITERAVFRRIDGEMTLVSVAPGNTVDDAKEGMPAELAVAGKLEDWHAIQN